MKCQVGGLNIIRVGKMEFEKRYNEEGQVAVLISPGYGAGWSTWAHNGNAEAMLFDSRLVDAVLAKMDAQEFVNFCESLGYDEYFGGADDLTVVWLDAGTHFVVEEYDGSESIRTFDDLRYIA
jgi:hypothetical protein